MTHRNDRYPVPTTAKHSMSKSSPNYASCQCMCDPGFYPDPGKAYGCVSSENHCLGAHVCVGLLTRACARVCVWSVSVLVFAWLHLLTTTTRPHCHRQRHRLPPWPSGAFLHGFPGPLGPFCTVFLFFCLIVFTPLCFPKVGRKIHNHNYVCNDGVDDVHDNDDAVSILHAQRQSVLRPMARCCWRWHSIPNESYERCSLCTAVLAECLQSFELCTAPVLNRWNRGLHALPHVGAVCTHRRQRVHDDRSVVGNHGHKPGAVLPT